MLQKSEAIAKLNRLGSTGTPFSFYCDFLGENWCIEEGDLDGDSFSFRLEVLRDGKPEVEKHEIQSTKYKVQGIEKVESRKCPVQSTKYDDASFKKKPIQFQEFKGAFDQVVKEINIGNSFLTNLTFQTPIETNLSLGEIFNHSSAKYKLLVDDEFVVFSPETFIKISGNEIFSYPMKGTIDAAVPNAKEIILEDPKELAEHVTIVDLIRNDLSRVASNVQVNKFRYMDELQTQHKNLLQVSSEVRGTLTSGWNEKLGSILCDLLPAGSISGAPKQETVRIIQEVENHDRGFYTGICGHFDGKDLDAGVMIRFIKKEGNSLFYCSGGGITSSSQAEKEYQEMVDKVYLPL